MSASPHWADIAADMVTELCGELSVSRLKQRKELNGMFASWELAAMVLLLTVLRLTQPSTDSLIRAVLADKLIQATGDLCEFVSERTETEWRKAPADEALLQSIEKVLITPLVSLIDMLTRQPPPLDGTSTPSPHALLLAAILPLPQRLLSAFQAQLAFAASGSWHFPADLSLLVPPRPRTTSCSDANNSATCGGEQCQRLHHFLTSATERCIDFRAVGAVRAHIEQHIRSLHTTHLELATLKSASPYTLRVSKNASLPALWKTRRAALQTLINRLKSSVASINDRLQASTTTTSSSASSSSRKPSSSPYASTSRPPLQPAAQTRPGRENTPPRRSKRKHDVIEVNDDEEQRQADKENMP